MTGDLKTEMDPASEEEADKSDSPEDGNDKENSNHAASNDEDDNEKDPEYAALLDIVQNSTPTTDLEIALSSILERKQALIDRLSNEISKMRSFVVKRKQTYKHKRKDEGAPTRALSAYNLFIRERFAKLAKENEEALKSDDKDVQMKRVPPANLVAATGNAWRDLPAEEKEKYEERAKLDRQRYEQQMATYQPPDKGLNRKRNKTGYNMFFSAHVLRLKQTEDGVPSERGSVARLVGIAWKKLTPEEKQYYEREADKHNGMNPLREADDDEDEDEVKRGPEPHYMHPSEMHMHGHYDPRYYPPPVPHVYHGQPTYAAYDYSQHHQRARGSRYGGGYPSQYSYDQGN